MCPTPYSHCPQSVSRNNNGRRLKHHQLFLDKCIFILIFLCCLNSVHGQPKHGTNNNSNVDHLLYDSRTTNSSVNSLKHRKNFNTNNESNNNSILVDGNSVDDILNDFSEIIGSSDNYNVEDEYYESFSKHKPKPTIYLNEFAVHIPAGEEMADAVAQNHGFTNLGQVSCFFFVLLE